MASIDLVTANRIHVVESIEQMTLPAGGAITAGDTVTVHPAVGKFVLADADESTTPLNIIYGLATRTVVSGETLTAVRRGVMSGWDFTGVDYWTNVLLSDTAGDITVTTGESNGGTPITIGRVIPVWDNLISGTPDKAVLLTL